MFSWVIFWIFIECYVNIAENKQLFKTTTDQMRTHTTGYISQLMEITCFGSITQAIRHSLSMHKYLTFGWFKSYLCKYDIVCRVISNLCDWFENGDVDMCNVLCCIYIFFNVEVLTIFNILKSVWYIMSISLPLYQTSVSTHRQVFDDCEQFNDRLHSDLFKYADRFIYIFSNISSIINKYSYTNTLTTRFMGPTWDPPGSCRLQMGPM